MSVSYEEFLYFLQLHIPLKDQSLSGERMEALYRDYLACEELYQAEPMDYFKYRFYALDGAERAEYLTRRQYEKLCFDYSTPEARANILDKRLFAEQYVTYLGREVLMKCTQANSGSEAYVSSETALAECGTDGSDRYLELCARHRRLMCKPIGGGYGKGIFTFDTGDIQARKAAWEKFAEGQYVIEEIISQLEEMAAFYSLSVNTVRSVTVVSGNKKAALIAAALRTGQGGGTTDNAGGGGIFANIDIETGEIVSDGTTHLGAHYACHPDTGVPFKGRSIPCWDDFKRVSKEAAEYQGELRLCCWDWALTAAGEWALIEGNLAGGIGLNQTAAGRGLKREVLAGLE